jgi:hypothetical protein
MIYLTPFLFSLFNRIRGGLLGTKGASGPIAAVLMGGWLWLLTQSTTAAISFAVAYALGEAPGWGKWLVGVTKQMTQEQYNTSDYIKREDAPYLPIHKWANGIAPEGEHYQRYAFVALIIRAAIWWVLPLTVLVATGVGNWWAVPALPVLAIIMPTTYYLVAKATDTMNWSLSEWIYGFIVGLVIMAVLL